MRGITYDVLRMTYEKIAAGSLVRSILAAGCWQKVGAREDGLNALRGTLNA